MCQNEVPAMKQDEKRARKFTVAPIEAHYQQAKIAEKFLELIKDTLEKCDGCAWGKYEKGIKFTLLFSTYDDECLEIGYVGDGMYLLDSNFIYQRFRHFTRRTDISCGKSTLYSKLFQMGILMSRKSKTKPLCTVWYNKGLEHERQRECICIPMWFVDFDADKIKQH